MRVLTWTGVIAATALVYVCIIRVFGRGFYCPIWLATGHYCPGCGVSRMCLRLMRLDIPGAFRANPLLLVALPFFLALGGAHVVRYIKKGPGSTPKWEEGTWLAMAGAFLIYGVLRNLPAFSFLAPV